MPVMPSISWAAQDLLQKLVDEERARRRQYATVEEIELEEEEMKILWRVYVVNINDGGIVRNLVLARDEMSARAKALDGARFEVPALAEADVDDLDLFVEKVGAVREKLKV